MIGAYPSFNQIATTNQPLPSEAVLREALESLENQPYSSMPHCAISPGTLDRGSPLHTPE